MDSISAAVSPMFTAAAVKLGSAVSLERTVLAQQGEMMSTLLGSLGQSSDPSGLGRLLDVRV
jgi:hypothetical protein